MDPALRVAAGHHLDLALDITRALVGAGHDVHVYTHADIEASPQGMFAGHAAVTPIFRVSPYDGDTGTGADAELERFTQTARLLAEDLRNVRPAQLWVWPTLFASQHYACVITNPGILISGCMFMEPTYLNQTGKALWRRSLTEARDRGTKFDLGVVEPTLYDEYLPLTVDGRLKSYPFPYDGIRAPRVREKLATIGFFGNQRDEKGVALFEPLISRLLQNGFYVVLHDSNDRSQGSGNERLRLLLGFVPNLAEEIVGCDLVVVPYRPEQYRYKGSGLVWSTLANGVPVVAPRGSAPGKLVESCGAGKLFDAFTPESILRAILEAERDYPRISSAAREVSLDWPKRHGIRNFVDMLLTIAA
jgi:glycosyltransferase involved in cell wall biosynthesis